MATVDPYAAAKAQLVASFYPTPSAGFGSRLMALLGLTAYMFAVTVTFLILYYIALRRQGKKVWIWRRVIKPEGSYISACIYTASVLPCLLAAFLIGALVANDRNVYVLKQAQYRAFLWRNVIWIVVWLQGWISAFANVQAVLITSTDLKSHWVPRTVNGLYIGVPIFVIAGLLVPGVLCSNSWDYAFDHYEKLIALLDKSSAYFQQTGQLDLETAIPMATLKTEMEARVADFMREYLGMLIVWTIASFLLVLVNIAGVALVLRLRKQVHGGEQQDTQVLTLPRLSAHMIAVPIPSRDAAPEMSEYDDRSFSFAATPSAKSSEHDLSQQSGHVASARQPLATRRAMKKLIRDLVITLIGVTFLALIFASDTILLAVERSKIYNVWFRAEIGVTMIIWAYILVAGLTMTAIALNEAYFLYRTASTPLMSNSSNDDPEKDSQRRAATEAIQIVTRREVTVEVSQRMDRQGSDGHSIPRVPVPTLGPLPSFLPMVSGDPVRMNKHGSVESL